MKQTFTSAATSINKSKVPALYHKINFSVLEGLLPFNGLTILDYGCGQYSTGCDFVEDLGHVWTGYDPNHCSSFSNAVALSDHYDIVVCSSVLNVIDSDEEIQDIASLLPDLADYYFVSVYDGDRSGVGRQTGPDQWQRNEKIQSYLRFFPDAVLRHGVITNCPEGVL